MEQIKQVSNHIEIAEKLKLDYPSVVKALTKMGKKLPNSTQFNEAIESVIAKAQEKIKGLKIEMDQLQRLRLRRRRRQRLILIRERK